MAKLGKRKIARRLRQKGKSLKEIAKKLSVSPALVYTWCQDLKLTPQQRKKLDKKVFNALQQGRKKIARRQRQKRLREIRELKVKGVKKVGNFNKREFFSLGRSLLLGGRF